MAGSGSGPASRPGLGQVKHKRLRLARGLRTFCTCAAVCRACPWHRPCVGRAGGSSPGCRCCTAAVRVLQTPAHPPLRDVSFRSAITVSVRDNMAHDDQSATRRNGCPSPCVLPPSPRLRSCGQAGAESQPSASAAAHMPLQNEVAGVCCVLGCGSRWDGCAAVPTRAPPFDIPRLTSLTISLSTADERSSRRAPTSCCHHEGSDCGQTRMHASDCHSPARTVDTASLVPAT